QLGDSLFDRNTWFHAAHQPQPFRSRRASQAHPMYATFRFERYPKIDAFSNIEPLKCLRRDPDDRERHVFDDHRLADRVRITAEPFLPHRMTEHCDRVPCPIIFRCDWPALNGVYAQICKVISSDKLSAEALHCLLFNKDMYVHTEEADDAGTQL